ncbi:hypothetical protein ABEB36_011103 [Hypothenemus hampei]|uniref:Uncharacterized protein n=1 Tax=Hypothenemus hampei TaxID=57062 RepID=A0ABD1EE70_HYPHA
MDDQYFVRTFEIDALNTSLKLYQKCEGDVGCVVWDASIVLAKYLEEIYKKNSKQFQNLTVVELGSGAGCVGLTAACFGAKVLLTDLSSVMPLLKKNLEANYEAIKKHNGEAHAEVLEWGKIIHSPLQPVLILIADCVYYKEIKLSKPLSNWLGR